MSEQKVGITDLERFLKGRCSSPKTEASTIWTLLVYNSSRDGADGLPLHLSCDVCGKEFGECKHNSSFNELFDCMQYTPKQGKHWKITVGSLRETRRKLDNMEIRLLGSPEKSSQRRKLLYA